MTNQLHQEKSTYLLERANQPVDWMTWSSDALQKAQSENKPLLISIGYSACHWCQTMSRENFEDSYVASLMNRHFVCILIDREERPDLDQVFMEAVQMFNQSQGGPSMFSVCLQENLLGRNIFPQRRQRRRHRTMAASSHSNIRTLSQASRRIGRERSKCNEKPRTFK